MLIVYSGGSILSYGATRIAHSSVLIDFAGHRVLTDPWFSEKFGYYHGEPYGIRLSAPPRLDGVAVSHGHYDHYDMEALQAYPDKQVPIAVKRGIEKTVRRFGFTNVIDMDAWETTTFGPITVTATGQARGPRDHVYAAMLIPELSEIPQRFPRIDVALLAINGLQIRFRGNRQEVMNAQDAAELCRIIRPRYAVPIHYTFTGGPILDTLALKYAGPPQQLTQEFQQAVAQYAPETTVRILAPGEPLLVTEELTQGSSRSEQ